MLKPMAIVMALAAVTITAVSPAAALTAKQKMETCKFGADDQKLKGKARTSFISKCMANERAPKKLPAPPKPEQ